MLSFIRRNIEARQKLLIDKENSYEHTEEIGIHVVVPRHRLAQGPVPGRDPGGCETNVRLARPLDRGRKGERRETSLSRGQSCFTKERPFRLGRPVCRIQRSDRWFFLARGG